MSGPAPIIGTTFIDRVNRREFAVQPKTTSLTLQRDMRNFTSPFDFEIEFARGSAPDIHSHDYVEFWTMVGGAKVPIGVGFIEDFVKDVSPSSVIMQANGRDFFAQLMNFPFEVRVVQQNLTYRAFLLQSLKGTYFADYLSFRNINFGIVDQGLYTGQMFFQDVATAPRASVLQQYADLAQNLIFQDRFGRPVVYGRSSATASSFKTGNTLNADNDINVYRFTERQNFSKVFSSSTVLWSGVQNTPQDGTYNSRKFLNTDSRASGLNQPSVKIFSPQDLGDLLGSQSAPGRIDSLAKHTIRTSNQNLSLPVLFTEKPYWLGPNGQTLLFDTGQIWGLTSKDHGYQNVDYKLVGIHYQQSPSSLEVQLAFTLPDTLV